jgi:hypothetical protein
VQGRAPGRTKCRLHGGATPVGADSPHFRHGRRSKYLPTRLLESYHAALNDPNLVSLREDLATADTRILELLRGVDVKGTTLGHWKQMSAIFEALRAAHARGDQVATQAAVVELDDALTRTGGDVEKWEELRAWADHKRKLSDTEQRRLERAHPPSRPTARWCCYCGWWRSFSGMSPTRASCTASLLTCRCWRTPPLLFRWMTRQLSADIVLLATDGQPRTLIRAQLIEEGFDVAGTDSWPMMRGTLVRVRFRSLRS